MQITNELSSSNIPWNFELEATPQSFFLQIDILLSNTIGKIFGEICPFQRRDLKNRLHGKLRSFSDCKAQIKHLPTEKWKGQKTAQKKKTIKISQTLLCSATTASHCSLFDRNSVRKSTMQSLLANVIKIQLNCSHAKCEHHQVVYLINSSYTVTNWAGDKTVTRR